MIVGITSLLEIMEISKRTSLGDNDFDCGEKKEPDAKVSSQ